MVNNGDMRFLLLELILADQLASSVRAHIGRSTGRSTPLLVASSGPEWQYEISTVRAHIGRSTGRSTLLVEASSARQHGMYIMGCIWQPLWILQEKMGICFYFLMIRVVISQLAL